MPEKNKDESIKGSKENVAAIGNGPPAEEGSGSGPPAGVVPLFFSGAGQQIFDCVVDKDLTTDSPNKLISKEIILEDFRNRAAVSDFHPVKKAVQVSP